MRWAWRGSGLDIEGRVRQSTNAVLCNLSSFAWYAIGYIIDKLEEAM